VSAEVFTPTPPVDGEAIGFRDGRFEVPDRPIIPFIEGDGTGPDIWRASVRVLDAAVARAYGGKRSIAGWRSWPARAPTLATGRHQSMPAQYLVRPRARSPRRWRHPLAQRGAAPGPSTSSACAVRWFRGVPSPVRDPSKWTW
jgi:isocitrate dehydrogenase